MILLEITGYSEYSGYSGYSSFSDCLRFSNMPINANGIIIFGEPEHPE